MTAFVTYQTANGAIRDVALFPTELYASIPAPGSGLARLVLSGGFPADPKNWLAARYVLSGAVTLRATMTPSVSATTIAANGTASCVISGLADPCVVTIGGIVAMGPSTVTGGTITLTSDHPGDITVTVTAEPAWLPWSTVVHAV